MKRLITRPNLSWFVIAMILYGALLVPAKAGADVPGTADDAIALVASHPAFSDYLPTQEGWWGRAYYSDNRWHIWIVELWSADGDQLGLANVNVERAKVYSVEAYYELTDEQYAEGETAAVESAKNHPDVRELLGDPDEYDSWSWHDASQDLWVVGLYDAGDTIEVLLRFNGGNATAYENPELVGIRFPTLPGFDAWQTAQGSNAVAVAFTAPEVGAAVRDHPDWTSRAELDQGTALWNVTFLAGETPLVLVSVNLQTREIVAVTAP